MKRKNYTEEQIIGMLKEHEAGMTIEDLSRKHGVAKSSLQRWKSKYGGMEVSEAKRLRELEAENAKLKKCQSALKTDPLSASKIDPLSDLIDAGFCEAQVPIKRRGLRTFHQSSRPRAF